MDYKRTLAEMERILNDLNESAYQQGYDDCEAEMEKQIDKARDEGYEQGYKEALEK